MISQWATPKFIAKFSRRMLVCEHGLSCVACCWPWFGDHNHAGYGRFYVQRKKRKAHVISYILFCNDKHILPDDIYICHECDNTNCVNYHHLFPGNAQINNMDKMEKGRRRYRIESWEVSEVRRLFVMEGMSVQEISNSMIIAHHAIYNILRGKRSRFINPKVQDYINKNLPGNVGFN